MQLKLNKSKNVLKKLLKRKIVLEYTRSTHEFKVTIISNTMKPSK